MLLRAAGASFAEIEEKTGVAAATVRRWMKGPGAQEELMAASARLEQARQDKAAEFAQRSWEIIEQALGLVESRVRRAREQEEGIFAIVRRALEEEELPARQRQALISKLEALELQNTRDVAALIGALYDKRALCLGQPAGGGEITVRLGQAEEWAR